MKELKKEELRNDNKPLVLLCALVRQTDWWQVNEA